MPSYQETEQLIFEVRKRPTIWDVTNHDYKRNKIKTKGAWVEVCRALNPQYDEKSDTEKKQILWDLQTRWKSIRDSNNRSQKKRKRQSGPDGSSCKKYVFADHLAFLQKINTMRETNDSAEAYTQDESFPQDQEDKQEVLARNLSPTPTPSPGPVSLSNITTEASCQQKMSLEQRVIPSFMDSWDEKDADKDFFNSLLPFVKNLTEDQKLTFRSEVITALQRVKSRKSESSPEPFGN